MGSRINSAYKRAGFTLIELLLAIALLVAVTGFVLSVDVASYLRFTVRDERDVLVSVLQKARMEAMNNVDMSPHGVAVNPSAHPGAFVLFDGLSYENSVRDRTRDVVVIQRTALQITPAEIVFEQLSGTVLITDDEESVQITEPQSGASTTIHINHEGRISW